MTSPPASLKPSEVCSERTRTRWGLWRKQSVWLPTFRGGLLLVLSGVILGVAFLRVLHPFFAITDRVPATLLVVEGWGADYMMETAARETSSGGYQHVITTGGPLERIPALPGMTNYAQVAFEALKGLGVPTHQLIAVPSLERYRNRTFGSALALRNYARTHGLPLTSVNVLTLDVHARRSRLCFQRALGPEVQVGIIALEPREYDPDRWWRFSEGVKSMISELIAYPYAWLSLDYGG